MKIFVIGGVGPPDADADHAQQLSILANSMRQLGRDIVTRGHDLLVCSPFSSSADIDAVRGAAAAFGTHQTSIVEFHAPDVPGVQREIDDLTNKLSLERLHRYCYPPTADESGRVEWTYTWLLAQVSAMDRSAAIIALGGRLDKSASLLLALAESRRKHVLPLTFLNGAAGTVFQRRRYELEDRLSDQIAVLHEVERVGEVVELVEVLARDELARSLRAGHARVFISYPRSRPAEADFVEMTLRRRNCDVYRDERDFGAGHQVHGEIVEHIHRSNIFVVIWCKEYACSPWCYDEFELALRRHKAGSLALWILRVDDTRVVPPDARDLISYSAPSRQELQSHVLELMEQALRSEPG
jgi:TIR domain